MDTTEQTDAIPDDLIGTNEAARLGRCHLATIYRWCESGRLRCWKRAGRRFVSRAKLLALFRPVPAKNGRTPAAQVELTRQQAEAETSRILREFGLE